MFKDIYRNPPKWGPSLLGNTRPGIPPGIPETRVQGSPQDGQGRRRGE